MPDDPAASAKSAPAPSVSDHLAGWITDLTSLHDLVERLAGTATLDDALQEILRAGAALVGARRGFLALEPSDGNGPERTIGLGLARRDLGQIETVPRSSSSYARLLDELGRESPSGAWHARRGPFGTGTGTAADTTTGTGTAGPGTGTVTGTGTATGTGTVAGTGTGTLSGGGPRPSERPPITQTGPHRGRRSAGGGDGETGATGGDRDGAEDDDGAAGNAATTGSAAGARGAGATGSAGATGEAPWGDPLREGRGDFTGTPPRTEIVHADIATDETLDPRHREVAARLGYAASYAVPLGTGAGSGSGSGTGPGPQAGAAVWLYDEPAEPSSAQRHLLSLYLRCASQYLARHVELARARDELSTLDEELLPSRLPRVPGVALARRHRTGPYGGGDWYDVLPLPEGALGLSVGGVTGGGPSAVAARARMQASLRAYAVMEGEDPVAVLSDLELLLRLTEPARAATALFAYAEPATRRVVVAGAGHCPPLVVGPQRTEFVETTLSAPLGMLACWEAPSVEITLRPGETLLLYSDGLLHRTGQDTDHAFALLHAAATAAPLAVRADPEALADHVLHAMLPPETAGPAGPTASASGTAPTGRAAGGHRRQHERRDEHPEDVVLLAARF